MGDYIICKCAMVYNYAFSIKCFWIKRNNGIQGCLIKLRGALTGLN